MWPTSLAARNKRGTLPSEARNRRTASLPDLRQLLVVSAVGDNRPDTLQVLTRAVRDAGCNLEESRMSVLGSDFAALLLVSGNWSAVARLESSLPRLRESLGLNFSLHRTGEHPPTPDHLPYAVDVVCRDRPGIVHQLAEFFTAHGVRIAELHTRSYAAAQTGAPMFSLQMTVNVPEDMHIAVLRDEFMDFCDHMNLDAILEPIKN